MIFLGNHRSWINQDWINEVTSRTGYARPKDWQPAYLHETIEYDKAKAAGYNLSDIHFWLFDKTNTSFDLTPPWVTGEYHWWITKMNPGQFTPMHRDPHTVGRPCKRYWMPLLDYAPGHIFVYKDSTFLNYSAGDVYSYEDSTDMHGAANIGHTVRLVLQVTEYAT